LYSKILKEKWEEIEWLHLSLEKVAAKKGLELSEDEQVKL
jgi:hypothetical protein